jgi:hypothetical protein
MQTHKPELVSGGLDRTKMFHVKHFGEVRPENLTRRVTVSSLSIRKIDRFFGAIGMS